MRLLWLYLEAMDRIISRAISIAGSQLALARACGVTQAAVSKWLSGKGISIENAIAVERATNGSVTVRDLRPDLPADIFGPHATPLATEPQTKGSQEAA